MSGIIRLLTPIIFGLVNVVPAGAANATPVQQDEPALACTIDYAFKQLMASRFASQVKIRNTGTAVINGWTLSFTLPEPQRIVLQRNARFETFSGPIIAHNTLNNGVVQPGNTVTIGFDAEGTGTAINEFTVNGTVCGRDGQ